MSLSCRRRRLRTTAEIASFLFLVLSLSQALANGQMAGVSTNGSNDTHYSYKFSGTVVNSATGEPIARALVQIFSQSSPAIFSDSSGHFEFNDLPELHTTVVARKPGFFAEQEIESSPRNSINVHIGPDTPPITIKRIPEGVIYGKVESN